MNERGHLEIGGCDVVELAERFGTPAYIYAEDDMRGVRANTWALHARTDDFEVIYATKALPVTAAYRLMREEGLSVDVASGGRAVSRWPPASIRRASICTATTRPRPS